VSTVVKASGTDYGLGLEMSLTALKANGGRAATMAKARAPVPLELEAVGTSRTPSRPCLSHARS